MIINAEEIAANESIQADLCVVGAGVAGIIIARELAAAGMKVCLIDSGGWEHDETLQSLNRGENIGYPYYPAEITRERRFGGSSARWGIDLGEGREGVRLRPLHPIDFEKREDIPHSGWPFGFKELRPYYERAHTYFGLGPFDYEASTWSTEEAHQIEFEDKRVESTVFQFGPAKHFLNKERQSAADSPLIDIIIGGTVLEIETNPSASSATALRARSRSGKAFKIEPRITILAGGGIEVPRLLLLSNTTQKEGLGNGNDLVGRYFMEHPHLLSGFFIPASKDVLNRMGFYRVHRNNGTDLLGYLKLSEETIREEGLANYCVSLWPRDSLEASSRSNFLTSPAYGSIRSIREAVANHRVPRHLGRHLKNVAGGMNGLVLHILNRKKNGAKSTQDTCETVAFELHHMWEQTPNPDSRITLSKDIDDFGQPCSRIDWQFSEKDMRTLDRAQEIIDEALRKAGLGHLRFETTGGTTPRGIAGGLHHMGTTRMAENPSRGVVDSSSRVHHIDNLYVAGSSVFPTSGCANPTLTIGALAIRLADHLRDKLQSTTELAPNPAEPPDA